MDRYSIANALSYTRKCLFIRTSPFNHFYFCLILLVPITLPPPSNPRSRYATANHPPSQTNFWVRHWLLRKFTDHMLCINCRINLIYFNFVETSIILLIRTFYIFVFVCVCIPTTLSENLNVSVGSKKRHFLNSTKWPKL